MHPTAARELPADQRAWASEPKWDGYRALGQVVGGGLTLRSRNGVDMAGRVGRRRGAAVAALPYVERRRLLENLEVAGPAWRTVGSFLGTGTALLAASREQGLEGVVAKRLRFAGRVDHGLVPAARRRDREALAPLVVSESPFAEPAAALLGGRRARPGPDDPAPVFVRPELAVEVSFLGWEGGRLRHPAYSGLRQLL